MDSATEIPKTENNTPEPANLDPLRGADKKRVNLGAIVRGGVDNISSPSVALDQITQGMNTTSEQKVEAITRWLELKPERNALTARLISDIWKRLESTRDAMRAAGSGLGIGERIYDYEKGQTILKPFKLDQIREPVKDLRRATSNTFDQMVREWEEEMRSRQNTIPSSEQTLMDKAYTRLRDIVYFGTHNGITTNDSTGHFIERGIGTASTTMWGVLEVIPRVFEIQSGRKITGTELEQIAINSLPVIMHLAAGNSEIAIPLLHYLTNGSIDEFFDPQFFTLTTEGGKTSLRITELALQTVRVSDGSLLADYVNISETTGCPAIQARGEKKNVIAEMWDWTLDLARQAYFPTFSNT